MFALMSEEKQMGASDSSNAHGPWSHTKAIGASDQLLYVKKRFGDTQLATC